MPAELDRISDSETELDSDMIVEEDYSSNKELLAMLGTGLFIMTAIVFGLYSLIKYIINELRLKKWRKLSTKLC